MVLAATDIRGGGERWRLYLTLHCHLRNDSCIETGNDESHFNVLLSVRDGWSCKTIDRPQLLKREESWSGFEPRSFRFSTSLTPHPLGQSGWLTPPWPQGETPCLWAAVLGGCWRWLYLHLRRVPNVTTANWSVPRRLCIKARGKTICFHTYVGVLDVFAWQHDCVFHRVCLSEVINMRLRYIRSDSLLLLCVF